MLSAQKSFSQKITGAHGAPEVRRTVSFLIKSGSASGCSSSMSLSDMVEPPDWEELSVRLVPDRDPLCYPSHDMEVAVLPRRIRTLKHVMPEEDLCDVPLHVRECVRCHTSDFVAVDHHYRAFSSSCPSRERLAEKTSLLQSTPRQDYEIDIDPQLVSTPSEELTLQGFSQPSSGRQSVSSTSSLSSCSATLTPRGSWASLDLRASSSDPLLPELLEHRSPELLDQLNEARRVEGRRGGLLQLYAQQAEDTEAVERRAQAEPPAEVMGHRILVKCLELRLELDVEPIFASMALYDAKEKKKVSENFHFDLNSECVKQMLSGHVAHCDVSTLSRSAVFDVLNPSPDLFLVVRLEKVLQGDITECVEPYIKDDKNREKVRSAAFAACERLGKYRMPFAWTALNLMNVISGSNSLEREPSISSADKESLGTTSQSNSLDRKSSLGSLEHFRRQGVSGGSLTRRGSLERRALCHAHLSSAHEELAHTLDTFKPIPVCITSFYKQESDKLRDEDLYKFLPDLKRPSTVMKKLKSIPGCIKLLLSPCPEEIENGLTPELAKLNPYEDNINRPCKEILAFPMSPMLVPHYQYRNLLYVCPRELNFTAFTRSTGSARNIAIRVQLMSGEEQSQALKAIFGRSSCPEFTTEAYTTVTYHNKCPTFYDEIKIKLPANLSDNHHLLFTFYHISCQRKPVAPEQEKTIETPIGYSWLPMCRSGRLSAGEYSLPVMLEPPPPNYSFIFPDVLLPGTKWIDNHRPIFTLSLEPFSSVNPMDTQIERFIMACEAVQEGVIPPRIGLSNMEAELRNSIIDLPNAGIEPLVKSLPVLLDKLILFLVLPPSLNGQQLNIAQDVFCCITQIFSNITNIGDSSTNDAHGRNSLLGSYIQFQCLVPRPPKAPASSPSKPDFASSPMQMPRNKSGEMFEWCSGLAGLSPSPSSSPASPCKVLHEELSLQWVIASGLARDLALHNSWSLFELMIKSMVEQLGWSGSLDAPRKSRFPDQYLEDIAALVGGLTTEVISRHSKDARLAHSLNCSLAFFLFDLLSIVDRGFVFGLVKTYYKQMSTKIASLPDAVPLIHYKLAFLRIVCSHEHYVSLNLPCGTPYTSPSSPSSPSPSTHSSHSTHSHSSTVSYQLSSGDRGCYTELTPEYRHQHYLVGLLLSELAAVLDVQSPILQGKAACAVLSLLTSHDADSRFSPPEVKARVAALYLPLLAIVMDAYPQLYRGFLQGKDRLQLGEDAINSTSYSGLPSPDAYEHKKTPRAHLNSETTRNLLMSFIWVLKSVDKAAITRWCGELPPSRIHTLLQVLSLCLACFEYKGKKEIQRCTQQNVRKSSDIKSRLEDVILGQGSARSEMMMRRRGCNSKMSGEKLDRWRKEWIRGGSTQSSPVPSTTTPLTSSSAVLPPTHLEGALAADVSLTVLHTLETIVQVASGWDSHHSLFGMVLRVLLLGLAKNQSTNVLQNMFATQRSLVFKFHWLVFDSETEQCGELCLVLLRHCGALCGAVRAHAAATLYLLMRQNYEIGNNFARVKMQVTMSLSSLVGTSATFSEDSLRRALKTILLYAEQDHDLQNTSFPEQVKDLVLNLHMILSDTVKMKEFQEDPEMLLDLMHRIARGYQNSPDLRLTWLANMAQKHMERSNHTEAGMCLVHSAALVAEYLVLLGATSPGGIQGGAVALEKVTPNALQESAVSDDVLAPRSEGICLGKDFSQQGLQALLEHAAACFHTASMHEALGHVCSLLLPMAQANRDYKKLANIHGKLNEAYTRIEQLSGKRVFGTYFRVGFYGSKFGDLNGEEFIYKEPTLTKLPEIFSRLENFYSQRFGADNVVIIKDSNTVDTSVLDADKAYIQITYVEPYFEPYELRYRLTHFERNFNIKRFIYSTPFTLSGRAHGELVEQCKRKTILTTAHHFPYVKTRIQVTSRTQLLLSPIEVAIEDIQKKINELAAATNQEPPDPKILQMVVQGCMGTTVNQGPLEMAQVFLAPVADNSQPPTRLTNKLRLCFKDFSKKCADALKKNKNLIGNDQKEYQRELERNYQRFTERLAPLIVMTPGHVAQLSNGMKGERRFN